ncbi:MAG: hypothetical protein HWE18_10000 [Gammaproteobacteria bacterium]|nr:hypothetical protein [Gammaproteobacteria bacterium]
MLKKLNQLLESIPYPLLLVMSVFMLIAPIQPEPHLVQKFHWLVKGLPFKAIDVFDVFWHLLPLFLLGLKFFLARHYQRPHS